MPIGYRIGSARDYLATLQAYVVKLKERQCELRDLVKEQIEKTLNNHAMVRDGFESEDKGREIDSNDLTN